MITRENIEDLKPFQARAIIEGLRKGVVPSDYIPFFTVGRQNWIKFVDEDLNNYIAEGGSKVRFINGDYGDGKTHFMSVIQCLALQEKFATSFVVLTRDVPIHKFEVVYQEIVTQLRGNFEGIGIRYLIDDWAKKQKLNLESNEDVKNKEELIEILAEELRSLPGMDLNFANALIALFVVQYGPQVEEKASGDTDLSFDILHQWFEGYKVAKKDLKAFHIFESINKANSKSFLRSLIAFLRHTGHKGLVLFFDELETVLSHATSVRNAAYENIRLLIDNTEYSEFLHIFFSIIPDVLLAEKGFKSYDALWSRVRTVGDSDALNYRSSQIDLHRTPLSTQELVDLGMCLRRIHEQSYRWNAKEIFKDEMISQVCRTQQEMGVLSEVRLFIKLMIYYLDMAEQGGSLDSLNITERLVASQKEIETEKTRQFEPVWDR